MNLHRRRLPLHRAALARIPLRRPEAGRCADAGAAARRSRLRRPVGRFPRKADAGDRLRRLRLFARRLRSVVAGEAPASADIHARRSARCIAGAARHNRLPARPVGRPQRRRVDCRDLCGHASGSPPQWAGADGAAFLHRGYGHRRHRRGEAPLTRRPISRPSSRAGTRTRTTPSRAGTMPGSIPAFDNGISPGNLPTSACRS